MFSRVVIADPTRSHHMFQQDLAPLGSLTLSALVALLPLATIFVLLGWLRVKAHWAGLAGLAVAILVAVTAFGMPVDLALLSATEGVVFGLFPIMWIVFTAIWLYQLTVVSGRFEDLRAAFNRVSDDPRVQAHHHRVLLRRPAGGPRRVRRPGRDHRRHADVARLLADARRGRRAAGQHRPGRVRRDRHPDHHRRHPDRHPVPRDRRRTSAGRPRCSRCSCRCCW